jgi:hypothetical protein
LELSAGPHHTTPAASAVFRYQGAPAALALLLGAIGGNHCKAPIGEGTGDGTGKSSGC